MMRWVVGSILYGEPSQCSMTGITKAIIIIIGSNVTFLFIEWDDLLFVQCVVCQYQNIDNIVCHSTFRSLVRLDDIPANTWRRMTCQKQVASGNAHNVLICISICFVGFFQVEERTFYQLLNRTYVLTTGILVKMFRFVYQHTDIQSIVCTCITQLPGTRTWCVILQEGRLITGTLFLSIFYILLIIQLLLFCFQSFSLFDFVMRRVKRDGRLRAIDKLQTGRSLREMANTFSGTWKPYLRVHIL